MTRNRVLRPGFFAAAILLALHMVPPASGSEGRALRAAQDGPAGEPVMIPADSAQSSRLLSDEPRELLAEFQRTMAREQYGAAQGLVESLQDGGPRHTPWARLMEATLIATTAADYGENNDGPRFHSMVDGARETFEDALDVEEDAGAQRRAAIHAALGQLALLEAQWSNEIEGSALGSVGPAGDAYDHFKEAWELDPSRYDALAGMAAYRFFRSHTLRALSWLPFVSDDREEAITDLRKVFRSDSVARYAAAPLLAWSLIEMERYDQAVEVCETWRQWFETEPRALLEPCAKAYFMAGRTEMAGQMYDRYIKAIKDAPYLNEIRLAGALNRAMMIARRQGDWRAVYDYANRGLAAPLTDSQWEQVSDIHDAFEEHKQLASHRLGN